jgi:alcohol dehydrogenase class IV
MNDFQFATVPRVICEAGAAQQLADYCKDLGISCPLVVTDPGLIAINLVPPLLDAMTQSGLDYCLFDRVAEDPPEAVVYSAVEAGARCDGVIGLGGGSSMDVAKVVATLLGGPQRLSEMYGVDQVRQHRIPLILVPTTAGTGSEVTPVAVITTGETTKAGVSSRRLLPDLAVLDVELTMNLPPRITAMTGIDAMVHAIEAYTSKHKKNPVSDMLAREALRLLAGALPKVLADGSSQDARRDMLLGAHLAGQAFANAPVAAVHALAYPLGGHFHIPHGLSNSLVLVPVLRFNATEAQALYAELADCVLPGVQGDQATRCELFISELAALIRLSGLPTNLADADVPEAALSKLASDAMLQQRLLVNNPRAVTETDALAIYQAAYQAGI